MQTKTVSILVPVTRGLYVNASDREPYATRTVQVELRAEVQLGDGVKDEPVVTWLDKAVPEDAGLNADELEGAVELAVDAAWQKVFDSGKAQMEAIIERRSTS